MPLPSLLGCPCCGGKSVFIRVCFTNLQRPQWRVFCTRCQLRQLSYPSRPKAALAWNRRKG
jgi:Lar family restriction alleviation protein